MNRVSRVAYAPVAHDATPHRLDLRGHDPRLDRFLLDHFDALHELAARDVAPTAIFSNVDARHEFFLLRTGNDGEFLRAAENLTHMLIDAMDRRMEAGLLVCVQIQHGDQHLSAGAFKLEVVTPNSAVLERLDSGDEVLAAVTNVMDAPGELQKGALVDDPRGHSEAVISDRLSREAQYFPKAFGIRIEQRPRDAAVDLLREVQRTVGQEPALRAAQELPRLPAGTLGDVLDRLGEVVPEVQERKGSIEGALRNEERPVRRIDTERPLRRVIRAGEVTIHASPRTNISVDERPSGGWRITVDVDVEPRTEIRGA